MMRVCTILWMYVFDVCVRVFGCSMFDVIC